MKKRSRTTQRVDMVLVLVVCMIISLSTGCSERTRLNGQGQSHATVEAVAQPTSLRIDDLLLTASALSGSGCNLCRIEAGCYPCRAETDSGRSFEVGYEARGDESGDIYLSLQLNGQELMVTEGWGFIGRAVEDGQLYEASLEEVNFIRFPFAVDVHSSDPDIEILGVYEPGFSGSAGTSYSCFAMEGESFTFIGSTEYEPCSVSMMEGRR